MGDIDLYYISYLFDKDLFSIDGTKSIVGTISPSVGIGKTSLDSSTMVGIVASIVGVSVTIVSQTTITVVTTIQDSGISFSFTFLTAIDGSKSIVGTISPSVGVGKTSLDSTVVTGIISSIWASITIVTTIQDSGISFSFSLSFTFGNYVGDGTNSIVWTIGPSIGIGKTSLDGTSMAIIGSMEGVPVTIVSQTITIVTTV